MTIRILHVQLWTLLVPRSYFLLAQKRFPHRDKYVTRFALVNTVVFLQLTKLLARSLVERVLKEVLKTGVHLQVMDATPNFPCLPAVPTPTFDKVGTGSV